MTHGSRPRLPRTVRTGQGAVSRTTRSATLPSSAWATPRRPCDAITRESMERAGASPRTICSDGAPRRTKGSMATPRSRRCARRRFAAPEGRSLELFNHVGRWKRRGAWTVYAYFGDVQEVDRGARPLGELERVVERVRGELVEVVGYEDSSNVGHRDHLRSKSCQRGATTRRASVRRPPYLRGAAPAAMAASRPAEIHPRRTSSPRPRGPVHDDVRQVGHALQVALGERRGPVADSSLR